MAFELISEDETIIDVDRIVAFVTDAPGSLGGVRIGSRGEDLEKLGLAPDGEIFLGSEDPPEEPEIPYQDDGEEWAENWKTTVTQSLHISVDEGAVMFIAYTIRGWTPSDGWPGPGPNEALDELRQTLLDALAKSGNKPTATGKVSLGDDVLHIKKVRKHPARDEPWAQLELEIEIQKPD